MLSKSLIIIIVVSVLSGCSTNRPKLTRDQWLDLTVRTYPGVSKDEVLSAVERLFELADGDDFQVAHTESGIYATRNWTAYMIIAAASGIDYWKVDVVHTEYGVKVAVQVNTQSHAITPMATTNGGWTATTIPMAGMPVQGTAIYDVFWSRMDYLLGKRQDWMDCGQADARVKSGATWGTNEALCNSFNIKDNKPS